MMSNYLGSRTTVIDCNAHKSIIAIIALAVIGPCMFILQPAYVQGLVEYMNFSEEQGGLITSVEMFGIAATAIGVNFVLNHINWRTLTVACLTISTICNFLSVGVDDAGSLMILRFLVGLGSGGLISITFTMMGLTERADRNLGLIVSCVLTYGAFGLLVMPTVYHLVGVEGLLVFFGVFNASGFLFVANLPCSNQAPVEAIRTGLSYPWSTRLVALAGVLAYNIAIGIVWVYMFLVGLEAGIGEQSVANALTVSQFLGIAGAMIAVIFEVRFGRLLPLMVGILGGALGIGMILGTPGILMYSLGICIFNFLWNVTVPYMLAAMAGFDASGQMVTISVALQMLGYAVGPALAASLLGVGGYLFINSIAIGLFVLAAIMLIPGLRAQSRRTPLVVSDAYFGRP